MKMENEGIWQAFPVEERANLISLFLKFDIETKHSAMSGEMVSLGMETIKIPSRIYWKPPYSLNNAKLTIAEKEIINCIFSRHDNGFVRQKAIRNIIDSDKIWVIPYILRITGEYVIEILIDIDTRFEMINARNLVSFIKENPAFYNRTRARVQSYWNCYYRRQYPEKIRNIKVSEEQRYVGFRLLNKIENLL